MIPAFNTAHITPRTERIVGRVMKALAIKEGNCTPEATRGSMHVTRMGVRLLREMDGGAMYRDDALMLAGIGECDIMSRAIDRLVAKGVLEVGSHNGRATIHPTSIADLWLAKHGSQGSFW